MKFFVGNMASSNLETLTLWNQETLKPRSFETKKQKTTSQETKKPINFQVRESPARLNIKLRGDSNPTNLDLMSSRNVDHPL